VDANVREAAAQLHKGRAPGPPLRGYIDQYPNLDLLASASIDVLHRLLHRAFFRILLFCSPF